jgi:type IV fimbrial biogenesis protein FimT
MWKHAAQFGPSTQPGVTLVELIICLAILSILLGFAVPSLSSLQKRSQATVAINWVVSSVVFARHAAITRNTPVTLCPSRNGVACGGSWHEGMIAFTDPNQNRRVDANDVRLQRFLFPVEGATLKWRAFRNQQYLQMTAEGFTNFQNGNFVYCPGDKDVRFARQLVINVQARTRLSSDIDHDGIVEDRNGRDLTCN